ncbi:hypothetical protein VP01_1011g2 [Puccinia sorghi]|uniref:Uncharacterized protein n=1 Tax=Puccinia sorghi TaxID=27349 RepID=A0A0L6VWD4_9BASI|nr:hypothetical protein VP01_1011g2 [Puccinia sorghi]
MLQPSCHPNLTLCTVTVHQILVESLLENGWTNSRSFLGLSTCELQAVGHVLFVVFVTNMSVQSCSHQQNHPTNPVAAFLDSPWQCMSYSCCIPIPKHKLAPSTPPDQFQAPILSKNTFYQISLGFEILSLATAICSTGKTSYAFTVNQGSFFPTPPLFNWLLQVGRILVVSVTCFFFFFLISSISPSCLQFSSQHIWCTSCEFYFSPFPYVLPISYIEAVCRTSQSFFIYGSQHFCVFHLTAHLRFVTIHDLPSLYACRRMWTRKSFVHFPLSVLNIPDFHAMIDNDIFSLFLEVVSRTVVCVASHISPNLHPDSFGVDRSASVAMFAGSCQHRELRIQESSRTQPGSCDHRSATSGSVGLLRLLCIPLMIMVARCRCDEWIELKCILPLHRIPLKKTKQTQQKHTKNQLTTYTTLNTHTHTHTHSIHPPATIIMSANDYYKLSLLPLSLPKTTSTTTDPWIPNPHSKGPQQPQYGPPQQQGGYYPPPGGPPQGYQPQQQQPYAAYPQQPVSTRILTSRLSVPRLLTSLEPHICRSMFNSPRRKRAVVAQTDV